VASTVRGACRRVAAVATVIIGAMYVAIVGSFDVVERNRLVAQIDSRCRSAWPQHPGTRHRGLRRHSTMRRDVADSPVFLWKVTDSGSSTRSLGAPHLPRTAWSPEERSVEAQLGSGRFRIRPCAPARTGSWRPRALATQSHRIDCCSWKPLRADPPGCGLLRDTPRRRQSGEPGRAGSSSSALPQLSISLSL